MEPLQIILIIVGLAGAWALIELALVLRRARGTVDTLDKTVTELNGTLEEARPVVAKLDGVVDELQPAISQVEPLLKQANVAVEALSADLLEINGVLRDVSQVTGTASAASGAVTGIADAAGEKVQKLIDKVKRGVSSDTDERVLTESNEVVSMSVASSETGKDSAPDEGSVSSESAPARQYYTYDASQEADHE